MVGEKSIAGGIGVGYRDDPLWAKKSTPPVVFVGEGGVGGVGGGGGWWGWILKKTLELYCI